MLREQYVLIRKNNKPNITKKDKIKSKNILLLVSDPDFIS
jgi:hypothetical protein